MENEVIQDDNLENVEPAPATDEQQVDWQAKAKEAEDARKAAEAEIAKLRAINKRHAEKADLPKEAPKEPDYSVIEERVDLRLKNYSPDEVSEIEAYAKAKGIKPSEAEKTPFIRKAIEGLRAEKTAQDASAPAAGRVPTYKAQTLQEVFTNPKASAAEKQAAYQQALSQKRSNQSV